MSYGRRAPVMGVLWAFLALNPIVAWSIAALSPGLVAASALASMRATIAGKGRTDSWGPMARGLDYLASSLPDPIYTGLLIKGGIKFQYPLTSLIPFAWLVELAQAFGMKTMALMSVIGWLWLAAFIACCAALMAR